MHYFNRFLPLFLFIWALLPISANEKLELPASILKSDDAEARLAAMVGKQIAAKKTADAIAQYLSSNTAMRTRLTQWRLINLANRTEATLKTQTSKAQADLEKNKATLKTKQEEYQKKKTPALRDELKALTATVKELESRAQAPVNFAQLAANPKYAAPFADLSDDLDWLQFMLYSGEEVAIVRAITLFLDMAAVDPSLLKAGRKRDIAAATALEFTRNNWTKARALARTEFYTKNWSLGRLNKAIDTVPMSQLRVLCGIKGEHKAGYAENYQWCLENAHIPAAHYVGTGDVYAVCWRGAYRLNNIYGDSIHVNFYETYNNVFATYGQEICEMGGICGALSHFGAYAAAANGLPAQTMGEPGHCAYTVLVGDKWCPAYSLSWQRWLHWHPWEGTSFFSALQFSYDLYNNKNITKTLEAMDLETAALVMQDKSPEIAQSLFTKAIETQPLNYTSYRSYFNFLAKNGTDANKLAALRTLCQKMPPTAPEMAAYMLMSKGMALLDGASTEAKLAIASDFWKSIKTIGPAPWDVAGFISKQADWVGKGTSKPEAAILSYYSKLLAAVVTKPDFTPAVMTWGNSWAEKQSASTKQALAKETVRIISLASGKGASIETLLRGAIISTENMGDITSFNTLMKNVPEKERYIGGMPTWEPFAGDLVSKGGLISLSSTCSFDTPTMHAGILDPRGGKFHTDKDTNAWVKVKLPHVCMVSGIVIIPTNNSTYRQHNMVVQVSATGDEGSWIDVQDLGNKAPNRVTRIDMSSQPKKALYVRILRKGGPEYFHLNGIYVYGKRNS